MVQYVREPVAEWGELSRSRGRTARQALDDLATAEALTPPLSTFYPTEYLVALDALRFASGIRRTPVSSTITAPGIDSRCAWP